MLNSRLTRRQIDVLSRVARGVPDKRIARDLGISERCVRFHVHHSLGRVGAQSRAHAVAIAIEAGLIRTGEQVQIDANGHERRRERTR